MCFWCWGELKSYSYRVLPPLLHRAPSLSPPHIPPRISVSPKNNIQTLCERIHGLLNRRSFSCFNTEEKKQIPLTVFSPSNLVLHLSLHLFSLNIPLKPFYNHTLSLKKLSIFKFQCFLHFPCSHSLSASPSL